MNREARQRQEIPRKRRARQFSLRPLYRQFPFFEKMLFKTASIAYNKRKSKKITSISPKRQEQL